MTFTEWLQKREGFTSRAERLCEDFPEVKDLEKLRLWLKAAYLVGLDRGFEQGCVEASEDGSSVFDDNSAEKTVVKLRINQGETDYGF